MDVTHDRHTCGTKLLRSLPTYEQMFGSIPSMDRELLQDLLASGFSLEAIGERVGRHPSTIGYWVERHGLATANRERHRPRGEISADQLRVLVDAGLSIRTMSEHLGVSYSTVRHWLARTGLQSAASSRRRVLSEANELGSDRVELTCRRHGRCEFVRERRGYFRCVRCRAERVAERRREIKAQLVAEAGGRCVLCGYDRCHAALQFHHREPQEKAFGIAHRGAARSLARARREAAKCVLLCANCHSEVEAGVSTLL